MSFADDIEEVAGSEAIEAVVLGEYGWNGYEEQEAKRAAAPKRGELLSWEQARPMLDYAYDDGYGAPECDAIFAWTSKRMIFVSEYDGSTSVCAIPRAPTAEVKPWMPGG